VADSKPVLIIGAGISGLACGWFLRKLGVPFLVVEQSARPGGLIRSVQQDGYLLEQGPQSFLLTPLLLEIIRELGLESSLLRADPRAARYVVLTGKLVPVPLSPPGLFAGSLLGARTKWSFLHDAFGRSQPPAEDESIAAFVRRKFTAELLDRLVGPFVSGIYAGDPERLSLRGAFPVIHELEFKYGSVIRGAIKSRGENGSSRLGSCSFAGGNEALLSALAQALGPGLRRNTSVDHITREETPRGVEYAATLSSGGAQETLRASVLILATPAQTSATLLRTLSPLLSELLASVESAPVALLHTGYPRARVGASLSGFGFLVPRSENRSLLGTVWNSSLFPGRAPEGHVLFTSFAGGTFNPALASASPEEIRDMLLPELQPLLSLQGNPSFWSVQRYARAIPQYNLGHAARVETLRSLSAREPGLFLAGNFLDGPAVGACADVARRVAGQAGDFFRSRPA